jgi:hypothetical protein
MLPSCCVCLALEMPTMRTIPEERVTAILSTLSLAIDHPRGAEGEIDDLCAGHRRLFDRGHAASMERCND